MSTPRIVLLASGTGSLFEALANEQEAKGFKIVALITDAHVPALEIAQRFEIPTFIVPMTPERSVWDESMLMTLRSLHPDLVVSAGFMRILDPKIVDEFEGKLINTHPALSPEFPGAHAVRDALAAGVTLTGTTVHFVDAGVDTGAIIDQVSVEILPDDTQASLHERIKVQERILLVETVEKIISNKIKYENGSVITQ